MPSSLCDLAAGGLTQCWHAPWGHWEHSAALVAWCAKNLSGAKYSAALLLPNVRAAFATLPINCVHCRCAWCCRGTWASTP